MAKNGEIRTTAAWRKNTLRLHFQGCTDAEIAAILEAVTPILKQYGEPVLRRNVIACTVIMSGKRSENASVALANRARRIASKTIARCRTPPATAALAY